MLIDNSTYLLFMRERERKREEKTASLGARKLRERVRVWPKQTQRARWVVVIEIAERYRSRALHRPKGRSPSLLSPKRIFLRLRQFPSEDLRRHFCGGSRFDYSACQGKLFPCLAHVPSIATELSVRRAAVCDRFLSREISAISYGSESRVPRREIHSGRNWFGSDDTHTQTATRETQRAGV